MLDADPHALSSRDFGDAWGELPNMIAGNLSESWLSAPSA